MESAWRQLTSSLIALTMAGIVHADLSAYNLLWWEERLVLIDLPQAVEFTTNTDAFDLLHRDVENVGEWFGRRGRRRSTSRRSTASSLPWPGWGEAGPIAVLDRV